jgi:hypothetical protein
MCFQKFNTYIRSIHPIIVGKNDYMMLFLKFAKKERLSLKFA